MYVYWPGTIRHCYAALKTNLHPFIKTQSHKPINMFYNVMFCIHNISTVFWTVISLRRPDSRFIFLWLYPNTSTRRMVGNKGWGKVFIWFWSSLYISIDNVYTCGSTSQCWNVTAGQNIGGAWRGQFSMNLMLRSYIWALKHLPLGHPRQVDFLLGNKLFILIGLTEWCICTAFSVAQFISLSAKVSIVWWQIMQLLTCPYIVHAIFSCNMFMFRSGF